MNAPNLIESKLVAHAHMNPLLTVDDLVRLLRVDRRTVSRLCKQAILPPPVKLGGSNRWKEQDIAVAIDSLPGGGQTARNRVILKTVA